MIVLQITPNELKSLISTAIAESMPHVSASPAVDIIGRAELCRRLDLSEPTVIRWEKKGLIPAMHIGTAIRYDYNAVLKSLEVKKKGR